jgi:AhpD family alkylhydroperoxidase
MSRYPQPDIPEPQATLIANAGARPLNLYRILGNAPAMLDAWIRFAYALRAEPTTSRALRELMILRTAQLANSEYEWSQHERMARAAGVTERQIVELDHWHVSRAFSLRESQAIALTEDMWHGHVTDRRHNCLEAVFTAEERIELILTAGFYCMVPRVLDAIGVTTEGEEDAECDRAVRSFERCLSASHGLGSSSPGSRTPRIAVEEPPIAAGS